MTSCPARDLIEFDTEIADQMFDHTNHLIMRLQEIGVVRFIGLVIYRALSVGILDVTILHANEAANMVELMLGPVHY